MDDEIVGVFDVFESAEQARKALLAAGFGSVQLTVMEDEAGPVKGNFTVGDYTGRPTDPVYERDFKKTAQRGSYVMTVAAPYVALARAAEIMVRYGAYDPDRTKQGGASAK
jgi:hypothetical protein